MNHYQTDFAIFGGGIAGLWLLNVLRQQGYNALLFETNRLGGQQTIYSQGIIHGGLKYALSGAISAESEAISKMPDLWRRCLAGQPANPYELSLSDTEVISDTQYMWSGGRLGSRFTSFFASKLLRGRINKLKPADYPSALANPAFKGQVYRMNDLVVDTLSLLNNLAAPVQQYIYHIDSEQLHFSQQHDQLEIVLSDKVALSARYALLAAGEGNEALLAKAQSLAPPPQQKMQRRPLQMVMIKHDLPHQFYGHCIGASSKPQLTITSHPTSDGKMIWYLGGDVAEKGAHMSSEAVIALAKQEIKALFPWLNLDNAQWASQFIDRAEPKQSQLLKPDSGYLHAEGPIISCWPTKLTLAPDLARQLLAFLAEQSFTGSHASTTLPLASPQMTEPFWQDAFHD